MSRPAFDDEAHAVWRVSPPAIGLTALFGAVWGAVACIISEWLVPSQVASAGDHDILLANRLGFVYTTGLALWVGWTRRSLRRATIGVVFGTIVGLTYAWMTSSRSFLGIMVGFPALLMPVLAVGLGFERGETAERLAGRVGKGLVAGLILGLTYAVVLGIAAIPFLGIDDGCYRESVPEAVYAERYVSMMRRAGPIALGVASVFFMPLFQWAVSGLTNRSSSDEQIQAF